MKAHEILTFVNDRIIRCDERLGHRQGMLELLSKRIVEAVDCGLASAVYWHKWMTYQEAVQVRAELAACIA